MEVNTDGEEPSVIYNPQETDVIRAAYREHIHGLLNNDDFIKIGSFMIKLANHPAGKDMELTVSCDAFKNSSDFKKTHLQEVLQQFRDNTESAVRNISDRSAFPDYLSNFVPERLSLGSRVQDLLIDTEIKFIELHLGVKGIVVPDYVPE